MTDLGMLAHWCPVVGDDRAGEWRSTERVVFLHVPKAAGTSFGSLLRTLAGPEAEATPGERVESPPSWTDDELSRWNLVHGHFDIEVARRHAAGGPVLTMLRDPVERVASFYRYYRNRDVVATTPWVERQLQAARELDFEEWVRSADADGPPPYEPNLQVRHLSGSGVNPTSRDLRRALDTLRNIAFVGLSERFDESVEVLLALFGLPTDLAERAPVLNQSGGEVAISAELRDQLTAQNALDAVLHRAASERLDADLAAVRRAGRRRPPTGPSVTTPRDVVESLLPVRGCHRSPDGDARRLVLRPDEAATGAVAAFEADLRSDDPIWLLAEIGTTDTDITSHHVGDQLELRLDGEAPTFSTQHRTEDAVDLHARFDVDLDAGIHALRLVVSGLERAEVRRLTLWTGPLVVRSGSANYDSGARGQAGGGTEA